MTRLRKRLVLLFLAATLPPMGVTLWVAHSLIDRSLSSSSVFELDRVSATLENTARMLYQRERDALRDGAASGAAPAERFEASASRHWPREIRAFADSGAESLFAPGGRDGDTITLLARDGNDIVRYSRRLEGVAFEAIRRDYARARDIVEQARSRDLRRGFLYTFLLLAAIPWLAALGILTLSAHRISKVAMEAYDRMARDLQQSRERLVYLTRLESWQALARKTAHEVKNSLTPIRLTMEELASRHQETPDSFETQAARIIADEVTSLERRVRAFSEFAAEPPVNLKPVDAAELVRERVAFLKAAHPGIRYQVRIAEAGGPVLGDEDLLKAALTNLLENAAEAAGPTGMVLAQTVPDGNAIAIEVHDSGPGLSAQALQTLFEPTISFKRGGMGLGLSIARKSAVLCGGDIVPVEGALGGAGFRVMLSAA
ncbi:MAG: ATP-binding protein [Bryobacteraceae bacterium]